MIEGASNQRDCRIDHNGANGAAQRDVQEISDRTEAACYVAEMLIELRRIADAAGFAMLVKSLDAAFYSAYHTAEANAGTKLRRPIRKNKEDFQQAEAMPAVAD